MFLVNGFCRIDMEVFLPPALMLVFLVCVSAPLWWLVRGFEGHRIQKLPDLGSVLMHSLRAKPFDSNGVLVEKNQQENPQKPRKSKNLVQET